MNTVLFDLDGTILGNRRNKSELRKELARKYGVREFSAQEYYEVYRKTIHDEKIEDRVPVFKRLTSSEEIAKRIAEEYSELSLESAFIYRDAEEALQEIESKKGLVTDGPRLTQWRKIKEFDLERYFDCIVISGEVGKSKPGEGIFREALRSLNAQPKESLYVGNVPEPDVVGAKNAGLVSVLINRDGRSFEMGNSNLRPDYEIRNMRNLCRIIEEDKIHFDQKNC